MSEGSANENAVKSTHVSMTPRGRAVLRSTNVRDYIDPLESNSGLGREALVVAIVGLHKYGGWMGVHGVSSRVLVASLS
jgi:hypothetical protein